MNQIFAAFKLAAAVFFVSSAALSQTVEPSGRESKTRNQCIEIYGFLGEGEEQQAVRKFLYDAWREKRPAVVAVCWIAREGLNARVTYDVRNDRSRWVIYEKIEWFRPETRTEERIWDRVQMKAADADKPEELLFNNSKSGENGNL
jgi:hypothetical protein